MERQTDLWRDAPAPSPQLAICVVVPARNEAANLQRSLSALAAQLQSPGLAFDRRRYEVLLLANNCDDDSAEIARDFARRQPDLALHIAEVRLPPPLANIGHVRRLLMDAAVGRLSDAAPPAVVASTDGDTVVAPDWLARTLNEFESGTDAVGGRILIDASDDIDPRLRRRRRCDAAYRMACERLASMLDPDPRDPWPRHHQHFCASLAVTRSAYLQVGGLPDVHYLEDEALVSALRRADLAIRHSPHVQVVTSGRQLGRAEVGLAWQLRQWADEDSDGAGGLRVDDAAAVAARFTARARLRGLWQQQRSQPQHAAHDAAADLKRLAARWNITAQALSARTAASRSFGSLWDDLEASRHDAESAPQVPIRSALKNLRSLTRRLTPSQPALRSNRSSR